MYTPSLRVKNNGVPILSKAEIDAIGERFVQDFQPEVLTNPSPVDIEGFIEFYLGMTPDYQYLSHNALQSAHCGLSRLHLLQDSSP